jgi:hypothetical protein
MGWLDKILGREKHGGEAETAGMGQPSTQPGGAGAPPPAAPPEPREPDVPEAGEPDRM